MKRKLTILFTLCMAFTVMALPAYAADYSFDAPDAGLFATPTSDDTVYVGIDRQTNSDRSKNAAYIPPAFGSPTSYLPGSGELLTPNLVSDAYSGGSVNVTESTGSYGITGSSQIIAPSIGQTVNQSHVSNGYTAVTSDLYYSDDRLGILSIPELNLNVKVYQGTGDTTLAKGAGHFASTSIWNGNVAIAGHNRGVNNHFGAIHTLNYGDEIKFTTKLGSRTYEVYAVSKIKADDVSVLNDTSENIITLITCVKNQPEYRWCVQARFGA